MHIRVHMHAHAHGCVRTPKTPSDTPRRRHQDPPSAHTCAHACACIRVRMYAYTSARAYACTRTHARLCICMHTRPHIRACGCGCTRACVHPHAYIHIGYSPPKKERKATVWTGGTGRRASAEGCRPFSIMVVSPWARLRGNPPQYQLNKTKQHTHSQLLGGLSYELPGCSLPARSND